VVPEPSPPFPDPVTVQAVPDAVTPGPQAPAALQVFVGSQMDPEPSPPLPDEAIVQVEPDALIPGAQLPAPLQ